MKVAGAGVPRRCHVMNRAFSAIIYYSWYSKYSPEPAEVVIADGRLLFDARQMEINNF